MLSQIGKLYKYKLNFVTTTVRSGKHSMHPYLLAQYKNSGVTSLSNTKLSCSLDMAILV